MALPFAYAPLRLAAGRPRLEPSMSAPCYVCLAQALAPPSALPLRSPSFPHESRRGMGKRVKARKGLSGRLFDETPRDRLTIPTKEELERIYIRRVKKAERDERVDLTLQLTEAKTYMKGFTRPKSLRTLMRFKGGSYRGEMDPALEEELYEKSEDDVVMYERRGVGLDGIHAGKGKPYELPPADAYQPTTVYIVETRHPVNFGIGRSRHKDVDYGITRDLPKRLRSAYNSDAACKIARTAIENAQWPELGIGQTRNRRKKDYDRPVLDVGEVKRAEETNKPLPPNALILPSKNPSLVSELEALRASSHHSPVFATMVPFLADQPFWRPLIAVTFPTRPLACSLLRLCRSLPRGTPFYASVENADRKDGPSFHRRMVRMRVDRIRSLCSEISRKLAGFRGGFIGLRFHYTDLGRGVQGEGLGAMPPELDGDNYHVAAAEAAAKAQDKGVASEGGSYLTPGVGLVPSPEKEVSRRRIKVLFGPTLSPELKADWAEEVLCLELGEMDEFGRELDSQGNVLPGQEVEGKEPDVWGRFGQPDDADEVEKDVSKDNKVTEPAAGKEKRDGARRESL